MFNFGIKSPIIWQSAYRILLNLEAKGLVVMERQCVCPLSLRHSDYMSRWRFTR